MSVLVHSSEDNTCSYCSSYKDVALGRCWSCGREDDNASTTWSISCNACKTLSRAALTTDDTMKIKQMLRVKYGIALNVKDTERACSIALRIYMRYPGEFHHQLDHAFYVQRNDRMEDTRIYQGAIAILSEYRK